MENLGLTVKTEIQKATKDAPHEIPMFTLKSGAEEPVPTMKIRVAYLADNSYTTETVDQFGNLVKFPSAPIHTFATMITANAFAKHAYRTVKNDPKFHVLYDVANRPFNYIEAATPIQKSLLSAPCMLCGLVLPLDNLTVDHQRPQTNGEVQAILKIFRTLGLTIEGPRGPKGRSIVNYFTRGVALSRVPTQPDRTPLAGSSTAARYTLNNNGTLLYSFIKAADMLPELGLQCTHHLFNLKPACQVCNSRRGEVLKTFT